MDPNARTADGDPVSRQTIITWQYAPSPYEQAFIAPGIAPSIAPGMPAFMTPADPVTVFQMPRKVGEYLPISHEEQYLNFRPSKHEVSLIQSAHSSRDDSDRLSLPSEDTPCLRVKLLCSYGGKILPRPGDSRLRYVGGETRIIVVNRDATFLEFISKMKEVCHQTVALKYQLPDEDLDALISVTSDEDVENMIDEFDKLDSRDSSARLRVFLFAAENDNNAIVDNLEQKNSEQQYLDAINGLSESGSKRSSLSSDSESVKKPSYSPASGQLPDSLDISETRQVQGAVLSSFPSSQDPQPLNPSVSFPASAQMIETITNDTRPEMPFLGPSWAKQSFSGTYSASRLQEQVASALNEELLAEVHLKRIPPEAMAAPSQDVGSLVGQSQLTEIAAGLEGQTSPQFLGDPVPVQSALDNRSVFEALPGQDQRLCQNPSQAIRHDNGRADLQTSMAFYQQQPSLVQPSPYVVTQPAVVNKHYEYQDQVNHQWSTCSIPYSAAQVSIPDAVMGQHYQSQVHHTYNMAAVPDMNGQVWQTSPFYSGAAIEASRRPNPVLYMSTMVPLEQESNQGVAISQMHMPAVSGVPSGQSQPGMIGFRYVEAGERTPVTNEVQVVLNPVLSEQLAEQEASSYQYELASEADTISAKYEQAALSEGQFMQQLSSGMVGYPLQQPIEDLQNLSVSADLHLSPGNQVDAFATIGSTIVDSLPSLVEMKIGQVVRNNDVAFPAVNATVRPGEVSALPTSILDSALVSQQLSQNLSMPESEHQSIFAQQTTLPNLSNEPVPYGSNGPLLSFVDDNLQSPQYKSMTSYSSREREDFSSQPSTVSSEQNNWSSNEATRHVIYDLLTEDPSCSGLPTLSVPQNITLPQHVSVKEASPTGGNMMPSLIDMRDVQATNKANDTAVIDSSSAGNTNESASEEVLHAVSSAQVNFFEQQTVKEPVEENRQDGAKKHKEVHFKNEVTFEEARYASPEESYNTSFGSAVLAAEQEAIARGLQTIRNEDLEELRELGSGTFGTVYHGKWRGSDVAIKRIKASCFWGHKSEQERLKSDFWREAFILGQLHHPNVVAFYGVVPDGPGGTLATVTEFMVNGSLKQVLQKKDNRTVDRRRRMFIAMDAAFGMEYLHAKNIIHFDLKGENLLVNMRDPHRPICKVGDLGLSKVKHRTMVSGGVRGTLPWMAPELLNGSSNLVSEKVDVFSFGIVMWELLTGEEPYADLHYGAIIGGIVNNALRPTIPKSCDSAWQSLMERCWSNDPASRPTFSDIARELRAMAASQFAKAQPQGQVAG